MKVREHVPQHVPQTGLKVPEHVLQTGLHGFNQDLSLSTVLFAAKMMATSCKVGRKVLYAGPGPLSHM